MCEPSASSQLKVWLYTPDLLEKCRSRANRLARKFLSTKKKKGNKSDGGDTDGTTGAVDDSTKAAATLPATSFARDAQKKVNSFSDEQEGPWESGSGHPLLNPSEEALLVSFYASKLPSLIGPMAQVPRLRRESKVPATAAMFLKRFYLSNSIMIYDPKTIMVAAAFLASKVEDAMTDVRYLEEGTNLMNAPVSQADIIQSEINLLSGINFELLCFHPYKAVLAMTEDLRTYLKSEKGQKLVRFPTGIERPIVGQDLKPMHDAAQNIVNDVIVSDIPLLHTPGQVGLAALMVANEQQEDKLDVPQIDLLGYLSQRFGEEELNRMKGLLQNLCTLLRELKEGKHGCANHHVDMKSLKAIHKKLKKCRTWGNGTNNKEKDGNKKKKRKNTTEDGSDTKRTKSG